jgi:hypothetical protein
VVLSSSYAHRRTHPSRPAVAGAHPGNSPQIPVSSALDCRESVLSGYLFTRIRVTVANRCISIFYKRSPKVVTHGWSRIAQCRCDHGPAHIPVSSGRQARAG